MSTYNKFPQWNLPSDEYSLEPCCALKYFPEVSRDITKLVVTLHHCQVSIAQSEKDGDLQAKLAAIKTSEEEDFGQSGVGPLRGWLWRTLEVLR